MGRAARDELSDYRSARAGEKCKSKGENGSSMEGAVKKREKFSAILNVCGWG